MSIKSAERFIDDVVEGYKEQSSEIKDFGNELVDEGGVKFTIAIGLALTGVASILCISVAIIEVAKAIRRHEDE